MQKLLALLGAKSKKEFVDSGLELEVWKSFSIQCQVEN